MSGWLVSLELIIVALGYELLAARCGYGITIFHPCRKDIVVESGGLGC